MISAKAALVELGAMLCRGCWLFEHASVANEHLEEQ